MATISTVTSSSEGAANATIDKFLKSVPPAMSPIPASRATVGLTHSFCDMLRDVHEHRREHATASSSLLWAAPTTKIPEEFWIMEGRLPLLLSITGGGGGLNDIARCGPHDHEVFLQDRQQLTAMSSSSVGGTSTEAPRPPQPPTATRPPSSSTSSTVRGSSSQSGTRVPGGTCITVTESPILLRRAETTAYCAPPRNAFHATTNRRVFPSARPQSRVEVYFLAHAIDRMLVSAAAVVGLPPLSPSWPSESVPAKDAGDEGDGPPCWANEARHLPFDDNAEKALSIPAGGLSSTQSPPARRQRRGKQTDAHAGTGGADTRPQRPEDLWTGLCNWRTRLDVLLVGVREIARQCFAHVAERGILLDALCSSITSTCEELYRASDAFRVEHLAYRRAGLEGELQRAYEANFAHSVRIASLEGQVTLLNEQVERGREAVKESESLRRRIEEFDAYVARQTVRNAKLLQAEGKRAKQRLAETALRYATQAGKTMEDVMAADDARESDPAAGNEAAVEGGEESTASRTFTHYDKLVQCNMDAGSDEDLLRGAFALLERSHDAMTLTDRTFQQVYYAGSRGSKGMSTLGVEAIARVEQFIEKVRGDLARRHLILQSAAAAGNFSSIVATGAASSSIGVGAPTAAASSPRGSSSANRFALPRDETAKLLKQCEESVNQVYLRIKAVADDLDVSQLLDPLVPPQFPKQPCALCHRVELDLDAIAIEEKLRVTQKKLNEKEIAVNVMHEEAIIRSEQIESLHMRLKSLSRPSVARESQTDSTGSVSSGPPLELKLNIVCHCSTPGAAKGPPNSAAAGASSKMGKIGSKLRNVVSDVLTKRTAENASSSTNVLKTGGAAAASAFVGLQQPPRSPSDVSTSPPRVMSDVPRTPSTLGNAAAANPPPPPWTTTEEATTNAKGNNNPSAALLSDVAPPSPTHAQAKRLLPSAPSKGGVPRRLPNAKAIDEAGQFLQDLERNVAAVDSAKSSTKRPPQGHLKPLSWALRHAAGVLTARHKSDGNRAADGRAPLPWSEVIAQYFRATVGTKTLVDDSVGSLATTLKHYSGSDDASDKATAPSSSSPDPRARLYTKMFFESELPRPSSDGMAVGAEGTFAMDSHTGHLVASVLYLADAVAATYLARPPGADDDPQVAQSYTLDQALHALHVALFHLPPDVLSQIMRKIAVESFVVSQPGKLGKSSFLDTPLAATLMGPLDDDHTRLYRRVHRYRVAEIVIDAVGANSMKS